MGVIGSWRGTPEEEEEEGEELSLMVGEGREKGGEASCSERRKARWEERVRWFKRKDLDTTGARGLGGGGEEEEESATGDGDEPFVDGRRKVRRRRVRSGRERTLERECMKTCRGVCRRRWIKFG